MSEVHVDLVAGASASKHVINNWGITRLAIVTGIESPSGDQDTGQIFQQAIDAVIAVVGDIGDPCPGIDDPTYLEQFIPETVTERDVRIRIIYRGYPPPQFEFGSSLSQIESNLDVDGNPITVQYTYPSSYLPDPNHRAGKTVTQGGMMSKPLPEPTFTVRWLVVAGNLGVVYHTADYLMSYYMSFEGKLNDSSFTIGYIVGAAHTWLIAAVKGTSRDGGVSYEASMTFQYRARTWDDQVTFINPDDGKPPPDLVAGTGYKDVQMLIDDDFPTFPFSLP